MSWTVKPSRTQEITKRTEPYLSDEAKAKYEKDLIPRYPERRGALLPILHDLQHHERCIPHQARVEVAQFLNHTPGEVLDTVSFYEEFHVEPNQKQEVRLLTMQVSNNKNAYGCRFYSC